MRKDEFEIVNQQYHQDGGIFLYLKVYSIEFREESSDYFTTALFFILSFILPGPSSKTMKFKERIIMNYDGKQKSITLIDCNKDKVIDMISEI